MELDFNIDLLFSTLLDSIEVLKTDIDEVVQAELNTLASDELWLDLLEEIEACKTNSVALSSFTGWSPIIVSENHRDTHFLQVFKIIRTIHFRSLLFSFMLIRFNRLFRYYSMSIA
jgi:hypothetical protein